MFISCLSRSRNFAYFPLAAIAITPADLEPCFVAWYLQQRGNESESLVELICTVEPRKRPSRSHKMLTLHRSKT